MGHLAARMDTRVGTPSNREPDRGQPRHPHQGILHVTLHSPPSGLTRPAREQRPVVGQVEAQALQAVGGFHGAPTIPAGHFRITYWITSSRRMRSGGEDIGNHQDHAVIRNTKPTIL